MRELSVKLEITSNEDFFVAFAAALFVAQKVLAKRLDEHSGDTYPNEVGVFGTIIQYKTFAEILEQLGEQIKAQTGEAFDPGYYEDSDPENSEDSDPTN